MLGTSGTDVLENKTNLALLQRGLTCQESVLCTYLASGRKEVERWCNEHLKEGADERMWMLKDAGANCAEGLWVLRRDNMEQVLAEVDKSESEWAERVGREFVIQQYIERPKLWDGAFKFHNRMYVVMKGNGEVDLFNEYLVHVANKPFQTEMGLFDQEIHITNTAVNKNDKELFHGCPIRNVNALSAIAKERLLQLLRETFGAARRFMRKQRSADDFIHVGVDVMFDVDDQPYILECNVPPCAGMYGEEMESSLAEFFERMFCEIVRGYVLGVTREPSCWTALNGEDEVKDFVPCGSKETGLNALSWAMFRRRAMRA